MPSPPQSRDRELGIIADKGVGDGHGDAPPIPSAVGQLDPLDGHDVPLDHLEDGELGARVFAKFVVHGGLSGACGLPGRLDKKNRL